MTDERLPTDPDRIPETPIILPRRVLVFMYSAFFVLGVVAAIAGVPTLDLTTTGGYTTPWAILVAIAAAASAVAARRESRERAERFLGSSLVALLSAYVFGAFTLVISDWGDHAAGRAAFAVVLFIAGIMPTVRAWYLLKRSGEPRPKARRV